MKMVPNLHLNDTRKSFIGIRINCSTRFLTRTVYLYIAEMSIVAGNDPAALHVRVHGPFSRILYASQSKPSSQCRISISTCVYTRRGLGWSFPPRVAVISSQPQTPLDFWSVGKPSVKLRVRSFSLISLPSVSLEAVPAAVYFPQCIRPDTAQCRKNIPAPEEYREITHKLGLFILLLIPCESFLLWCRARPRTYAAHSSIAGRRQNPPAPAMTLASKMKTRVDWIAEAKTGLFYSRLKTKVLIHVMGHAFPFFFKSWNVHKVRAMWKVGRERSALLRIPSFKFQSEMFVFF